MNTKLHTYYRTGTKLESPYEKRVILPEQGENDTALHAWADTRFASDIMHEHALFFSLLMPEELAGEERKRAILFMERFKAMHEKIDSLKDHEEVMPMLPEIIAEFNAFIEYKREQQTAQESGKLRCLVWPLFFEHTRHEAERWVRRFQQLAKNNSTFERSEVVPFWTNIMDEHARFVAHLLDPEEYKLIEEAMSASRVFQQLEKGGLHGVVSATVKEPAMVVKSLTQNPEIDAVMSAAETILDFKTKTARDIEKARIKSIIEPRLADHVRREALKFIDELKRSE